MSEEEKEAIKLLKQEPDFSLSYYKRERAIDIILNLTDNLRCENAELRDKLDKLNSQIDKLQEENKKYIDIFNSTEKIMNGQERTKDKLLKENMILNSHIKYIKSYLLRFIPTSTKEVEIKSKILNKIGENNND